MRAATLDAERRVPVLSGLIEVGDTTAEVLLACARQLRELGRTKEIEAVLERLGRDGG
jgi:hypothetical protein